MISIGIIGCGAVTHRNYAPTLLGRDEYRVRWVHDLNERQAASAARLFNCEAVSSEELLEHADAVIIGTPPATHAELIRAALRPGRVILCEKPFMTSHVEARAVVEQAEAVAAPVEAVAPVETTEPAAVEAVAEVEAPAEPVAAEEAPATAE